MNVSGRKIWISSEKRQFSDICTSKRKTVPEKESYVPKPVPLRNIDLDDKKCDYEAQRERIRFATGVLGCARSPIDQVTHIPSSNSVKKDDC